MREYLFGLAMGVYRQELDPPIAALCRDDVFDKNDFDLIVFQKFGKETDGLGNELNVKNRFSP